jgi:hypothetical protein
MLDSAPFPLRDWNIMESLLKGNISTVDLLVSTSLDQLLLTLEILFSFLQNKLNLQGSHVYEAFPFSKGSTVFLKSRFSCCQLSPQKSNNYPVR